MSSHRWRVFPLIFVFACASCSGGPDPEKEANSTRNAEAEKSFTTSEPLTTSKSNKAARFAALVDLISDEANALPRAEFDPAALAMKLGKDPRAHFEWVRDRTWWVPYRGLLRGPQGVMLDRLGSNLDRALLLGELLRQSGHSVRLAHAQLSENRAKDLLNRVRPIPDRRTNRTASSQMSVERKRALESLLPGFSESQDKQVAASQEALSEAKELVRTQADRLYAAVRNKAPDSTASSLHAAISAMRDHWWIEYQDGARWIAMDMMLPDAQAGTALEPASARHEWSAGNEIPSIPDSDRHSVQIAVVIERYANGAISESKVLEAIVQPADALDRPVSLVHWPKPWPAELSDPKTNPNALGDAAVGVKQWVPILIVGDEAVAQSGFSDSGDLIASPLGSQTDIGAAGGGGFMSGFGEALGGDVASASSMTAEWIDYEIRVPGLPSQRLRRPIFDLLGPARRSVKAEGFEATTNERLIERYEALLSTTAILLQPCEFSGEFVAHLESARIVAHAQELKELSSEANPVRARELATTVLNKIDVWSPLPYLVLWRSALGVEPNDRFIDRPNILNYRSVSPVVNADRAPNRELIDIAANTSGVTVSATARSFAIRLRQGVADTVAEAVTLGGDLRSAENTASIFANVASENSSDVLIDARDKGSIESLGWPEDVAARLSASIGREYVAVATNQSVQVRGYPRVAWWRINSDTGETIGVLDTGFHGVAVSEQASLQHRSLMMTKLANWNRWERAREIAARYAAQGRRAPPEIQRLVDIADLTEEVLQLLIYF